MSKSKIMKIIFPECTAADRRLLCHGQDESSRLFGCRARKTNSKQKVDDADERHPYFIEVKPLFSLIAILFYSCFRLHAVLFIC
jgi:hypothetical protein